MNKFIAQCTGISRREADRELEAGRILVNGVSAALGQVVDEKADIVVRRGQELRLPAAKIVVALNKPRGYLTSRAGFWKCEPTVFDLLPQKWRHLRYAGRLDRDTAGLLIFTNDGQLIEELTHPRHHHEKEYEVRAVRAVTLQQLAELGRGMMLADGWARVLDFQLRDSHTVRLVVGEGRKRLVRRLCAAVHIEIAELRRVRISELCLESLGLAAGESRELVPAEILRLRRPQSSDD